MSTSRKHGRIERQQGYAAARAVAAMARKLRGRKLSSEEAAALTVLAAKAAGGSARAARKVTSEGKRSRRRRRSAIRSETRRYVRSVSSGRKRSRKASKSRKGQRSGRSDWLARRIQTSRDYVAYKKARKKTYGPMPFETQPSWLRAKFSKKYRATRARWASKRSRR